MIDYVALDTEWRARLKAEVPEFAKVDTGDALPLDDAEKLKMALRLLVTPACFTLVIEEDDARPGTGTGAGRTQIQLVKYVAGVVTQSLYSQTAASKGAQVLKQKVKKAGHGWKPTGAMRALIARRVEHIGYIGGRYLLQVEFDANFHETFS